LNACIPTFITIPIYF